MLLIRFVLCIRWRALLLAQTVVLVSGLSRSILESSSYFDTKDGYVLLDHVFHSQLTSSFTTCAQLCLTRHECQSLNFENILQNETVVASKRLCELNDYAATIEQDFVTLQERKGFVYARVINGLELEKFVFTNLGATGPKGPTNVLEYKGTNLDGKVQLNGGIQTWNVTSTGEYSIAALGASGGNGTCVGKSGCSGWNKGGKGASIKGTIWLERGMRLKIIVGQKGFPPPAVNDRSGGGGGGSFVVLANGLKPLIVAGGGGGGGIGTSSHKDGDPGQVGQNGTREGGVEGKGGRVLYNEPSGNKVPASSGAGLLGNGEVSAVGSAAKAFVNGGYGGTGFIENGGFGGGGFGRTIPGGGGGYSGGGVIGNSTAAAAGGGGSYNAGTSQENEAGVNEGDGKVVIIHIN